MPFLIFLVICIVYLVVTFIYETRKAKKEELIKQQQERIQKENLENQEKDYFQNNVREYFNGKFDINTLYSKLEKHIDNIETIGKESSVSPVNESLIKELKNKIDILKKFIERNTGTVTAMFNDVDYGIVNNVHWEKILKMNTKYADNVISIYTEWIKNLDYEHFNSIDINSIWAAMWVYATQKPYSAQKLHTAQNLFYMVHRTRVPDIEIAELYAVKQFGVSNVLNERVKNIIKSNQSTHYLTVIASGLMWMNAYQEENEILNYIFKSDQPMSAKIQERLHTLSTGGGRTPITHKVDSNSPNLNFDISSLTWKEEDYESLFNDLAFRGLKLSYSLAIRDEDKSVEIGMATPSLEHTLVKFQTVLAEEYGKDTVATLCNCVALSGNIQQRMKCILVKSKECEEMSIIVHFARVGKKLNIKIYTLFSPIGNEISTQKQQALSLYKKINLTATSWENALKDTIFVAIQQLLNSPSSENVIKPADNPPTIF